MQSLLFLFAELILLAKSDQITYNSTYFDVVWETTPHIQTKAIVNHRTNPELTLIPLNATEEFVISIPRESPGPYPSPVTDKSKWKITANSVKNTIENDITNLIDNNSSTVWRAWENDADTAGYDYRPNHSGLYNFTIDFGSKLSFQAISFTQKPKDADALVRNFKFFVGITILDLSKKVQNNDYELNSYFSMNEDRICYINLTKKVTTRYIALVFNGDGTTATGAQFDIYTDPLPYVNDLINSSNLKVASPEQTDQQITFTFETFEFNNVNYDIKEIIEKEANKHYYHKYLLIKISDENAKIDYIDLDHYVITKEDREKSWGSPFIDELFLSLGQPYYMNTFFAGCRFPYTHTMIDSQNVSRIRYYSGKAFKDLEKNADGYYQTWRTVFGAARDSRIEVTRADFFSYISDISVQSPFRKQYNSWYDWMLRITEENIMTSFKEIERGCTQYGLPPFDSYVVDDGWNNYNTEKYGVYDEGTSGTTYNQGGFWEFNDKFPHQFELPSNYSRKIGSNFGVWLGPRGGYVTPGKFGKMIEDAGKGFYAPISDDIDVGSHTYLKGVQKLLTDFIRKYKVNYYKLDGFVEQPCYNSTHDHMTGGPDGIYFFTDLWENVIVWYEDMIKTAKETGLDDFWISTTTWAAPSPFQLQWSNSMWIQVSGDKGEIVIGDNDNQADQMLTYRDDCYWQFYDSLQLQFPARCLYNHDPIYGQAGTSLRNALNDEYFRAFLYGCAMRGTAFFELYYTYDMLDEGDKWYISSDVLSWAEKNFGTLQHSQRFGGRPGIGETYGYSAWNDANGILSVRNPGAKEMEYTITLDRNIGVTEGIKDVYRSTLLSHKTTNEEEIKNKVQFSYGDNLTVHLLPGEFRIYEFHQDYDRDAPAVEVVKSTKVNEVMIRFNKRVNVDSNSFSIDNLEIVEPKLRGDRRTVTLTTKTEMENQKVYKLHLNKVSDIFGNELTTDVSYQFFSYNAPVFLIGHITGNDEPILKTALDTDSFTIRLNVEDFHNTKNTVLIHSSDNKVICEITNDNHLKFTVGDVSVTSESVITKSTKFITFVRERNALIKIYIGDEIDSSVHDKKMPISVSIKDLILNKNDIVYRYIRVFNYALPYSDISEEISLKNEYIERVFSLSNKKIKTLEINNLRTEQITTIRPEEGSEEFVFSIPAYASNNEIPNGKIYEAPIPIDRTKWRATANSEQSRIPGKEGAAMNMIDGNLNTIWHSQYNNNDPTGHDDRQNETDPFQVTFDLGQKTSFKAFSYAPRQDGFNGRIKHYELYVADTMEALNESIESGKPDMEGDFKYLSAFPVYVNCTTELSGQYIALRSVKLTKDDLFGSGADFSIYSDFVPLPYVQISASQFDLQKHELKQTENSQQLILTYEPFTFDSTQYNVTIKYELPNGKHYIEKEITIEIPENKVDSVEFQYIDLEHIAISESDKQTSWTHPIKDYDPAAFIREKIIPLGQPIYINSLFAGSRFPLTDTQITNTLCHIRYQCGKKFSKLHKQSNGKYVCWKTVLGTARSNEIEVVRNDFFDYINDISTPSKLRLQYNSWYDWMKTINETNILTSFKEIEHGLSQNGVSPLDSYVVDDGWNNYNIEGHIDKDISGTTINKEGFWAINDKFPNGLSTPSNFAHAISSRFGVWLGPRGGYETEGQIAKIINNAGNGYINNQARDIDVGSAKYTQKLTEFFVNWIKAYQVNYFKLDGWAYRACTDSTHDHAVGGEQGMYYYTDFWERYLDSFETMRNTASFVGVDNLWISLTCYVNPSPFFLQWVNSIWIQISNDVGYIKETPNDNLADQMINYRDNVYYNFHNDYQFQFPQQALYNHDPIYGKTGTELKNSLDDDEFRSYLLMCGMRGNNLYELYYSYDMIDEGEKWIVNAEVINYLKERNSILQHSQLFGGEPKSGKVYYYSAWTTTGGTIAIRNPSAESQAITISLNRNIGVPETIPPFYSKSVLKYLTTETIEENKEFKYNDQLTVNLNSREIRIIDFNLKKDDQPPKPEVVKVVNGTEILIRFNKPVIFDDSNYKFNHKVKVIDGFVHADLRSVHLILSKHLRNNTDYQITLQSVQDVYGNTLNKQTVHVHYMMHNEIIAIDNEIGKLKKEITLTNTQYELDSFTFRLNITKVGQSNADEVIIEDHDNHITIERVNGNHIKFTVGKSSVTSNDEFRDDSIVTVVRERNGMLKIYINDVISNSVYLDNHPDNIKLHKIVMKPTELSFGGIRSMSYAAKYNTLDEVQPDEEGGDDDDDDDENAKTWVIVGSTLGGVAALIIIVLIVVLLRKRRADASGDIVSIPLISNYNK